MKRWRIPTIKFQGLFHLEHKINQSLGGGFKYFLFSPLFGGRYPFWRSYFSYGLVQPPTRSCRDDPSKQATIFSSNVPRPALHRACWHGPLARCHGPRPVASMYGPPCTLGFLFGTYETLKRVLVRVWWSTKKPSSPIYVFDIYIYIHIFVEYLLWDDVESWIGETLDFFTCVCSVFWLVPMVKLHHQLPA